MQRAIARPNPVVRSIGEVLSQGQVRSLLKSAVPPRSSILYGPYRWGEGNNPTVCYGASREAVVGSSLTRREIEGYYSEWLSGWRREGRGDDVVSWDQTGRFTDSMVALSFVPELLPVDSEVGRSRIRKGKGRVLERIHCEGHCGKVHWTVSVSLEDDSERNTYGLDCRRCCFWAFLARRLPDPAVGETAAGCSADPQGARLDLRFPVYSDC